MSSCTLGVDCKRFQPSNSMRSKVIPSWKVQKWCKFPSYFIYITDKNSYYFHVIKILIKTFTTGNVTDNLEKLSKAVKKNMEDSYVVMNKMDKFRDQFHNFVKGTHTVDQSIAGNPKLRPVWRVLTQTRPDLFSLNLASNSIFKMIF